MGYDASVIIIFGIMIPLDEFNNFIDKFLKNLNEKDSNHIDSILCEQEFPIDIDIKIDPQYPYKLMCFNNGNTYTGSFLVLKMNRVQVVRGPDNVPIEIEPPTPEEITTFKNFLTENKITYPYKQYVTIQGSW